LGVISFVQRYIVRRLLGMIPALLGISILVFLLIHLIPGDPISAMLGRVSDPEVLAAVRAEYGLDRPLSIQYFVWLGNVVQGNLGYSISNGAPVSDLVFGRLPATLYLLAGGLCVALLLAAPIGILAAAKRDTWIDLSGTTVSLIFMSIPSFWLAILLILLLAVHWGLLPATGYVPPREDLSGFLKCLVMPSLALGVSEAGFIARLLRSSMLDVLHQDYVTVARAKGVRERRVIYRHAIPNALIPVITVVAIEVGYLLGGAIIIERVFAYPGMGLLTITAISTRDYPLIQGTILVFAVFFLLINLLTDLLYAVIDPRIKYG
jgi:peptide/nickel transport system permease protein